MKKAILLIACLLITLSISAQKITADYLIQEVNVIDVVNGTIYPNQQVAIQGDKIIAVSDIKIRTNKSVQIIDGRGKYLIPGLWDMHTHYNWNYRSSNPLLIANGITGIREMWGVPDTIQKIREATANGKMLAPDIYAAGNIVDGVPAIWPGSAGVKDAESAIQEVNKQIASGADFIKVYSLLTKEAYGAIAKTCQEKNIPFAGHIPDAISFEAAIEAGQQSTEHLYGLLEACTSQPERLVEFSGWKMFSAERIEFLIETFDEQKFATLSTTLAESDTWLCPTLTVLHNMANLDDTTMASSPRMTYMPPYFQQMWNPKNDFRFKNTPPSYYIASRKKYELQQSLIGKLVKAGVKMIAGTDYSNPYCYPGFSLHDELAHMVAGGMSTVDALKTATLHPAIFMDQQGVFGEVAKGQLASLVLLDENPLEDILNTQKIQAVFLRGKYMDRAALDQLLEIAKAVAKETNDPFKY